MAIITLTTDFGITDHYVAAVKGKILKLYAAVTLVDILHQIPNGDIAKAAFVLQSILQDFPEGTIHLVAVGTHTEHNRHLLFQYQSHYFIVPDNGILELIAGTEPVQIFEITHNDEYMTQAPAKSLYASVAARLALGESASNLGKSTAQYIQKFFPILQSDEHTLRGRVMHVDGYGNLITNLTRKQITDWQQDAKIEFHFGHEKLSKIAENFTQCDYGDCLLLFNATEHLVIGIRHGNAAQLLGMRYDSSVIVKRVK